MMLPDRVIHETKMPFAIFLVMVGICILPICLNLIGFDFGVLNQAFDVVKAQTWSQHQIGENVHQTVKGGYIHTILEWSAFMVAIITVVLAFAHFMATGNVVTPIIGMALFTAGAMDAFHTLAANRLIDAVADNQNLIPFTWALCRLFNAVILIVGTGIFLLKPKVKKDQGFKQAFIYVIGVSLLFSMAAYIVIHICARSSMLPQTQYSGSFITRPWDIAPLVLYVFAGAIIFPLFYKRHPSLFSHALVLSVIPHIVVQLHMAFGSSHLFDNHFNIAHFLKIVAYAIPLIGIILDYQRTYGEASLRFEKLQVALKVAQENKLTAQELIDEAEKSRKQTERALNEAKHNKSEVESINEFMTGREVKMMELKKEIKSLKEKLERHGSSS